MTHNASRRAASSSTWAQVLTTWLAGVLAAVALGAVSPVSSAVRSSMGLSLSTVVWATSSMTAVGAVLGVPAGWWIGRFGARRALLVGLVVISVAGGVGAIAGSWVVLLGSRTVQGVGYLLVFVSGPVVLTCLTRGGTRAAALALWGTCVPTGLAIAAAVGGALGPELTWNCWLGCTALGPLLLVGVLAVALPDLPGAAVSRRTRAAGGRVPLLALAGSYGCMSLVGGAVVVLLPSFLAERRHETSASAGAAAAIVAAGSAIGGVLVSWLLRRGVALSTLVPLAALMPLAIAPAFSTDLPVSAGVAAATLVLVVDGLLISAAFAAVPGVAAGPEQAGVANGLLAQFGSLGMLVGPPGFAMAVDAAGWDVMAAVTSVFVGLGAILLLRTARNAVSKGPGRAQLSAHGLESAEPSADPNRRSATRSS